MKIISIINGKHYNTDIDNPVDISIPLDFYGEQPNAYNADKASAKAVKAGSLIGDTRLGGSCNFEEYRLIPHCNGTHTECVGHISDERISILAALKDTLTTAVLISVNPEKAIATTDFYSPPKNENDFMITRKNLQNALSGADKGFLDALVIRTLPNNLSKKSRRYTEYPHPYFSIDAMNYVKSLGVKHLLVDIPSVDRMFDEGKLSAHHIFWNVEPGSHDIDKKKHSTNTITEMIFVPDEVTDGNYLLNLQVTGFIADASPSRPLLFKLKTEN